MDFGQWEGRAWNDIARADIDAWTTRFGHHAPGGGEPLAAMLTRVSAALDEAAAQAHAGGWRCGLDHACRGGPLRALAADARRRTHAAVP